MTTSRPLANRARPLGREGHIDWTDSPGRAARPGVSAPCAGGARPLPAACAVPDAADAALAELARDLGTPLYAFDVRTLFDRVAYLRSALPRGIGLCYAMKANTFVLPELAGLVDRIEVCSPGEFRICRALDIPLDGLVVSGVYKDEETVRAAIGRRAGAGLPVVTVESEAQMALVGRVAREAAVRVPVLLRLTSGNQFGLSAEALRSAVGEHLYSPHIELRGVQYFSGTQKTSTKRLARELARLDRFIAELEDAYGWDMPELEYGPGLPVAYFASDRFDEDAYLAAFSDMLGGLTFDGHITLELGRSLVASCGTYLTRVVDAKVNAGQRYAIVDGGMHQLVYYGGSMAMHRPACHVVRTDAGGGSRADARSPAPAGAPEAWNVCGALCTTNDVLVKQLPLAGLEVGDLIAFSDAGAYCMTEGIALFLSRDLPCVAVVDRDGVPRVVRDRGRTDVLNTPAAPVR